VARPVLKLNLHATSVGWARRGSVLITGVSGTGKSSLALALIEQHGASLIADDRTEISISDAGAVPSCPAPIRGLLEVRGIGLVPYPMLEPAPPLRLCVELLEGQRPERLPLCAFTELGSQRLPLIRLGDADTIPALRVMAALRLLAAGGWDSDDGDVLTLLPVNTSTRS